jgi:hypothetical protein
MTINFQSVGYGLGLELSERTQWPKTTRGSNPTPYTSLIFDAGEQWCAPKVAIGSGGSSPPNRPN